MAGNTSVFIDRSVPEQSVLRWPWALTLLLSVFVGLFALESHQISKGNFNAFATYYGAAEDLRAGQSPYSRITGAYRYVYPPFYAFALEPMSFLPRPVAARVMVAVNEAFILCALLLAARIMLDRLGAAVSLSRVSCIALATALLTLSPIAREIRAIQANALLLLCMTLALYWLDRRPVLAGMSLALAIIIKYVPLVGLAYFILRRRWTAAAATFIGIIVFALLPAISLGWSANLHDLANAEASLTRLFGNAGDTGVRVHELADELNVSVTASLARLALALGWRQSAAVGLVLLVAVGAVAALVYEYGSARMPWRKWPAAPRQLVYPFRQLLAVEWAAVVVAALVFSPSAEFILSVLPATLLIVLLITPDRRRARWPAYTASGLTFIALMLPVALMGHAFTRLWATAGTPSWILLAVLLLICPTALSEVRAALTVDVPRTGAT